VNVLSLFAGIGGLDLGLERAGMSVVGQVEIDPFCQRVLAKHWPEVPRHDDVRTAVEWWLGGARPAVDVVCGGFPCQPVSVAGRRGAQHDARWLWPAFADVVRGVRPRYVVVENVVGLVTAGLGDVLGDLAALGFDADWSVLSACAVGAPHSRERLFVVAYPAGKRRERGRVAAHAGAQPVAGQGPVEVHHWRLEDRPGLERVVDGIPSRLDRIRALGNAVVPQVAEHIGRLVMGAAA